MSAFYPSKSRPSGVKCLSYCLCCLFFIVIHCASVLGESTINFYSIHVSSCKNVDSARSVASQMMEKGHDAYYRYETVPGKGLWYRVYVRKSVENATGDQIIADLRAAELSDYFSLKKTHAQYQKIHGVPVQDSYFLHVGSFLLEHNARNESKRMQHYGYETIIARIPDGEKTWFKVFLLADEDKTVSSMAGEALRNQHIISFFRTVRLSTIKKLSEMDGETIVPVATPEKSPKKASETIPNEWPLSHSVI